MRHSLRALTFGLAVGLAPGLAFAQSAQPATPAPKAPPPAVTTPAAPVAPKAATPAPAAAPAPKAAAPAAAPAATPAAAPAAKVELIDINSATAAQLDALPGIGKYFITAALNRDYGLVLGTTILYLFVILALNLLVDVIYAWLDPKVRYR